MLDILKGLRVIDLTTVVLGPYATQMLGDLGAEVIKVESPEGDIFRHIAPQRTTGMGAGFLNLNRNKRSVCIDLKSKDGIESLEPLVAEADVVVHNMRPSAAKRLGVDYASLSRMNPKLIYCAAVGFGRAGPYADKPAYDDIVQAASGMAWLAADEKQEPRFVPTVLADKVGALFVVQGVLAGILHRQETGRGVEVEAPMYESMVNFLLAEHMNARVFEGDGGTPGYARLLSPNRRPYRTRDGYIAVMPYSTKHWEKVLRHIGRKDLLVLDWVKDPELRSRRIDELYRALGEALPSASTAHWLSLFGASDIPCTRVNRLDELFNDPHLNTVGFFQPVEHPTEGALLSTRYPLSFVGLTHSSDRPAPTLGEANDELINRSGADPD